MHYEVASGHTRPLASVVVPAKAGPSPTSLPLALSPDQRFLYAATRSPPFLVSTFQIDPMTGTLALLHSTSLDCEMCFLTTDRTGQYLFGASYVDGKLSVNRIGSTGCVEIPAMQTIQTRPKAHAVLLNRTNDILNATVLGGDEILQFAFDAATGNLTPLRPPTIATPAGWGPRHLVEHPTEPFVFVLNEIHGSVSTFLRDARSGLLGEYANMALPVENAYNSFSGADIHLTPDGKYLYATERCSNTLCSFEVLSNGQLIPLEATLVEPSPRSFAIDPAGRFLVLAGQLSNSIAIYLIDSQTGDLTQAHRLSMHGNPSWVEIIRLAYQPS